MYTRKSHTIESTMKLRFNIFFLHLIALTSSCCLVGMEEFCTDEWMDNDLYNDGLYKLESGKGKTHFHEDPPNSTSEDDLITLKKSEDDLITLKHIDISLKTRSLFNERLQKSIELITQTDHLAWQDEQTSRTRLHYAVLVKHKDTLQDILKFAKDNSNELLTTSTIPFLDLSDCRGATALHYTLGFTEYLLQEDFSSLLAMATLLIKHGASATVQNSVGETPLHYLARYFSYSWNNHKLFIPALKDLVKLLSEHGVKPDTPNNYGETALHYAFEQKNNRSFALDMVPILLDIGASVTAQTEDGNTPLHYALTYPATDYSSAGTHSELTIKLVDLGASPNTLNKLGVTPLYLAVSTTYKRDELVSLLLDKGGDPNVQSKFGYTPLYQTIFEQRNENLMKMLLAKGGDPNIKNHTEKNRGKGGRTMLQSAICGENIKLVEFLLNWSLTNPYIKDTSPKGSIAPQPTEGRTALEIAKHLQKATRHTYNTKNYVTVYEDTSQTAIDEIVALLEWYEHPVIKKLWLLMQKRYTYPDNAKSVIPYIIPYLNKALTAKNKTDDENNNNNNNDDVRIPQLDAVHLGRDERDLTNNVEIAEI